MLVEEIEQTNSCKTLTTSPIYYLKICVCKIIDFDFIKNLIDLSLVHIAIRCNVCITLFFCCQNGSSMI